MTHPCTAKALTPLPRIQRGFTLIEMLIVVALIGILASIAYPSYTDHVARGYIADATSALSRTRVAMEQFYQDRRNYGAGGCGPAMPANVKNFTVTCALGGGAKVDVVRQAKHLAVALQAPAQLAPEATREDNRLDIAVTLLFPLISGGVLAADADLLIHDSQYSAREYACHCGWGHSSLNQTLDFGTLTGVKQLVPFHHDPDHTDEDLDRLITLALEKVQPDYQVTPGMEGKIFEL